jgi:hypothetical protein
MEFIFPLAYRYFAINQHIEIAYSYRLYIYCSTDTYLEKAHFSMTKDACKHIQYAYLSSAPYLLAFSRQTLSYNSYQSASSASWASVY